MGIINPLDRFQLQNYLLFDYDVSSESLFKPESTILNGNRDLALNRQHTFF